MSSGPKPDWREIERVLGAALELPEDQRAAFLAPQPEPLRVEVEALLAAYRRSDNFLGVETGAAATDSIAQRADVKPGTLLGAYRIETQLGQGGMGVVYRALDTKLNRPVAVKFLFEELADPTARRRFQREAQMASSLNHPHILTVYDVGDFEGRQYLVTEFIDGGTLKDWARGAKRAWREIVSLLAGVADGLAAAHAAGILHRDIKPENVLVGRNGYAKLSDFGLAKLEERSTPDAATRIDAQTTRPGVVLGTIAYMSPEQASGGATDARSDIFSFGIMLYWLLCGRRPFEGATDLEVLQAIIHRPAQPLSGDLPFGLRMVVEKALEKDPAERYQSTRDLVVDLRRLSRSSGETTGSATSNPQATTPTAGASRWRTGAFAALILLVVLLGASVLWLSMRRPAAPASRPVVQFEIAPPAGTIFTPLISRQPFAISPDGRRLAFSATGANGQNIWIRDLASPELRVVPGTEGAWSVFWALDNRTIFFGLKGMLKQANLETGAGRTVAEFDDIPQLGVWRSNGDLVVYFGLGDLVELRLEDGNLRKVPNVPGVSWPQILPGRERYIYSIYDPKLQQNLGKAADYPSGQPATLMQTDSRVEYAPPPAAGEPSDLLFIRGGSLLAQPFDSERLKPTGKLFPIAQNVMFYAGTLSASFSVSDNGVLVYQAGFPDSQLKWYDRGGREVGEVGRPAPYWGNVRVSRDGQRVAASVWNPERGSTGVWTFDAGGRESSQISFPPEIHRRPVWSPDGTHLAVGRSRVAGGPRLTILDSSGGAPQGFQGPGEHLAAIPTDWSADGRFIVSDDGVGEQQQVAWIGDVEKHTMSPLLKDSFPQWGTAFSPDGTRVAFISLESGRPEVHVQGFEPAPSPHVAGVRRQVSRDGAWLVRWRGDGKELFYLGLDNMMQAVEFRGPLDFSEPKALFRVAGAPQFGTTRDFQFDVSPDGQRFILPTTGLVPPPPYTVIQNWQEKFRR